MEPWVGSHYQDGILGYNNNDVITYGNTNNPGYRLLILDDALGENYATIQLVNDYLNLLEIEGRAFQGFRRLERAITGAILSKNNSTKFWNHIALYHYHGNVIKKPKISPLRKLRNILLFMGADTFDNYIQASEEQKKADFDSVLLALKPNVIIILNHSFASLMMLRSDNSQKSVYSSANYDTVKLKIFKKAINGNNTTYVSFNSDTNDPYFNVDEYHRLFVEFQSGIIKRQSRNILSVENKPQQKDYLKLAYVWDKFLKASSSNICRYWSIDDFDHYAEYLWIGINVGDQRDTRRKNCLFSDDSVVINSSYVTSNYEVIYLQIKINQDGDYVETEDILFEEDLIHYNLSREDIPEIVYPSSPAIMELYRKDINLIDSPKKANKQYRGGTLGHLIIDGIDNFPLQYRLSKYSKLELPNPKNIISSQKDLDYAITQILRQKFSKQIDGERLDTDENPIMEVLQEVFNEFQEYLSHGFSLVSSGIITPALYYAKGYVLNVAFPLFNIEGFPFCAVTNIIRNKERGLLKPMTLLSMDEIRIDTRTFGDVNYQQPEWLNPGYKLPSDLNIKKR